MDLGLYIAASGMVAEQAREDQLANDLANASTPGFKAEESSQSSFGEMLLSNTLSGQQVGSINTDVQSGKAYTDLTPAAVHETGQPLDFAIAGEGFFAVRTGEGVRYTRDGQFAANASGELTDAYGDPVLSQGGAPIKVGSEGSVPTSALGVFELSGAAKQGENLFTGTPSGRASGSVRSGALEESGVDPVKAMVEMMAALRTFQSGQQAIQTIGGTLSAAATEVGSVTGQ
ncbi:MAG TPA: flagellar hook-basal body protein [Solirubrobacteraceae bacterium]